MTAALTLATPSEGNPQFRSAPRTQTMTISPEMAQRWLDEANTRNRNLRSSVVAAYARDMAAGRWCRSHQGIAFDEAGILLDGQHRLAAIVASGVTVEMMVTFDLSRTSQSIIDGAIRRTARDAITLWGTCGAVTNQEIATVRVVEFGPTRGPQMTHHEIAEAFSRHQDAVRFAHSVMKSKVRGINTSTTRGVIARAYYTADHDRLRRFGEILSRGMAAAPGDEPVALLWRYLFESSSEQTRSDRLQRYGKTERALEAFLSGERIGKLFAASRELFPTPHEA